MIEAIKLRHLILGRKVMTNLDSILKSRDITLPTKVHLVKTMVFPVVMYGCENWTISQPRILEWVAISFSRRSSKPRDQTHVSCLAGGFFTLVPLGKPQHYTPIDVEAAEVAGP